MSEELQTKLQQFWTGRKTGWGIKAEIINSHTILATIKAADHTIVTAYAFSKDESPDLEKLEEEAMLKALNRLLVNKTQ